MTEPHDPDELASAHVDGLTTAEEAARIAADPELQARVDALRTVRAALRGPIPIDAAARDAAIDAALAAFDEDAQAGRPGVATVTPLTARRGLSPTARRVLGAAAAVALLAILAPLVARSTDDDPEETAFDATGEAAEDLGAGSEAPRVAAGGDASSTTSPTASRPTELGEFDSVEELVAKVQQDASQLRAEQEAVADSSDEAGFSPCGSRQPTRSAGVGLALVGSREVVVTLTEDEDGLRLQILDARTCEVLVDRPL